MLCQSSSGRSGALGSSSTAALRHWCSLSSCASKGGTERWHACDCSSQNSSSAFGARDAAQHQQESSPPGVAHCHSRLVVATGSRGALIKSAIMIFITCLNYLN